MIFERIRSEGHEQVVYCCDQTAGLKAIIAIHSTVLGPAVGGCRFWNYNHETDALTDALRLSKGMSYKAAISELPWGGGKAVILSDPTTQKRAALFKRFGEFVDRFCGTYITAKDVGIGAEDLKAIHTKTKHVLGIEGESGSSGDPSPATAWGVYHGIRAATNHALGTKTLKGLRIAVQGLGSVAYHLIEHLTQDGAIVYGTDIDSPSIERAKRKYRIEIVSPDEIFSIPCDVYSPCALGATLNTHTISQLRAKVVAGCANNQLATPMSGQELLRRGIVYVPDYVINAGGLINIYYEHIGRGRYDRQRAWEHVGKIERTVTDILSQSSLEKVSPSVVADRLAEERINKQRSTSKKNDLHEIRQMREFLA